MAERTGTEADKATSMLTGPDFVAAAAATDPPRVKGVPVSGRVWKEQYQRASSLTASKTLRPGWKRQQELRKQRDILKTMQAEIEEERERERAERAAKLKERRAREEEKEKQAQVVTKISAAKLKRMTKKQVKRLVKV